MKQLWMLVGGNGAGKSTFYHEKLEGLGIPFINADQLAREHFPDDPEGNSYGAALLAQELFHEGLQAGSSLCFETVFSHPSKIDFLKQARVLGYRTTLVLIHLASPTLNKLRIAQRVAEGGHNVPEDKVEARIQRMLANVRQAIPLCDRVLLLDNSRTDSPHRPVATIRDGKLAPHLSPLPSWARRIVE